MSTSDKTSLGDRMKLYETAFRTVLPGRLPVIIRLDGKAFHTYTRGLGKGFSEPLTNAMNQTAKMVCQEIGGAQLAYVQSDEISVLIHGYKNFNSLPWFGNQVQKMVSVSASVASATMTVASQEIFGKIKPAYFDSRAFVIPENDVCNYFLWRQQDWIRNNKQMLARTIFSQKELFGKNSLDLIEMCKERGHDWNILPTHIRHGRCIVKQLDENGRNKWVVDSNIPEFKLDREYINKYLVVNTEKE